MDELDEVNAALNEVSESGVTSSQEILDAINGTPASERSPRQKYVQALRDFAGWLELHPDVATPSLTMLCVFPKPDAMGMYAREMGKCRKSVTDHYFNLTKDFLPAIQYEPTWYRNQVCERVVVGQKEVQEDVVEVVGKRTVTKDIVEWKCPKVLEKNPQISDNSSNNSENSLDKELPPGI